MRRFAYYLGLMGSMAAVLTMATGAGFAGHGQASVSGKVQSVNRVHDRVRIDGRVYAAAPGIIGLIADLEHLGHVTLKVGDHGKIVGVLKSRDMANYRTGTITALGSSTITLGTTTYDMVSGAPIHYRGYLLAASQVPLNTEATVELDRAGAVEAVWLNTDSALPPTPVISGTITAINSTQLTINGYTLTLASNVAVRSGNQTLTLAEVMANEKVVVYLDQEGTVDLIRVQTPGAVHGTVTADSSSSITIGSTAYDYASNVSIRYRQYVLTTSQVPIGSEAVVKLNASGDAQTVILLTDSNLPSRHEISGTISMVSGNTMVLSGYTLTMAPTFTVSYENATTLVNAVTAGETAKAWINGSGEVSRLVVGASNQSTP
jgi:hypothetical protein